jgi:tetratricopeptide (TPR) repeat protein
LTIEDPQETSVATTWAVARERVRKVLPEADDLLTLFAFLDPDIPLQLISGHAEVLPDPLRAVVATPETLDQAVGKLSAYGLVEATHENLSVHRLVQRFSRERLSDVERKRWAEAALRLVDLSFTTISGSHAWWKRTRLLPHVEVVTERAEELDVAPLETAALSLRAAEDLLASAQYGDALRLANRALDLWLRHLGEETEEVARALSVRADALREVEPSSEEPREELLRAVGILEAVRGPEDRALLQTLRILAAWYTERGQVKEALGYLERALRIARKAYGGSDARTTQITSALGYVLMRNGDLARARRTLEQTLDSWAAANTGPTADQIKDGRRLATILLRLGQNDAAIARIEDVVQMATELFGGEGWETLRAEEAKAEIIARTGDPKMAEQITRRTAALMEERTPPGNPMLGPSLRILSLAMALGEHPQEAVGTGEKALALYVALYGPDHPYCAEALESLGIAKRRLGDLTGARADLERAVRIYQDSYGPEYFALVTILEELAAVRREQGAGDQADELAAWARTVRERLMSEA